MKEPIVTRYEQANLHRRQPWRTGLRYREDNKTSAGLFFDGMRIAWIPTGWDRGRLTQDDAVRLWADYQTNGHQILSRHRVRSLLTP